jgi:hypothetical protein
MKIPNCIQNSYELVIFHASSLNEFNAYLSKVLTVNSPLSAACSDRERGNLN